MDYSNTTNQTIEQSSKFNYAQDILQRIGYLQYEAIQYFKKGDLMAWFFEWKSIKHQIAGKLDKKDISYLDGIERKISMIISRPKYNNKILILAIEKYLFYIQSKIEIWEMGLVGKRDETRFA